MSAAIPSSQARDIVVRDRREECEYSVFFWVNPIAMRARTAEFSVDHASLVAAFRSRERKGDDAPPSACLDATRGRTTRRGLGGLSPSAISDRSHEETAWKETPPKAVIDYGHASRLSVELADSS